jgi:hypothetical protein
MSVLKASPFYLTYNYLVAVKARAYNARGWGSYSSANTGGAYIETIPG